MSNPNTPYEDEDGPDLDEDDAFDEDCGLNFEDGQCALAGTEHCDWICPNRNSDQFAGNPGFKLKRKRRS